LYIAFNYLLTIILQLQQNSNQPTYR